MIQIHALAVLALLLAPSPAHAAIDSPAPILPQGTEILRIPLHPNSTNTSCPVMGKTISTRLFTDTKYGRIYLCCKACVEEVQADVDHAYKTAYPTTEKIENKVCPVTRKPIGEDAVHVELQGLDFLVVDKAAAVTAVDDAQATLAKLLEPELEDVANQTCPVTGEPVTKNTIAVIAKQIVRFASPKAIEEAKKDPKKVLAKALEIRAKEDRERAEKAARESTPAPKKD